MRLRGGGGGGGRDKGYDNSDWFLHWEIAQALKPFFLEN